MSWKERKGFTLIEMLVVVMIISVLALLGLSSYRSANRRARDSRRQADLEQVRSALEMYRTDVGTYPIGGGCGTATWATLNSALSGTYITQMPEDPGSTDYTYSCLSSGQNYRLCAVLENTPTTDTCPGPGSYNYGVVAPL